MRRLFSVLLAGLALLVTSSAANAQDATAADPDHYVVEFENDLVRVLRVTYGPGESSVMHEHPDHVAVGLTSGMWKMTNMDGDSEELDIPAGATAWADAVMHVPQNMTDSEQVVILIELKSDDDHDDHDDDHD